MKLSLPYFHRSQRLSLGGLLTLLVVLPTLGTASTIGYLSYQRYEQTVERLAQQLTQEMGTRVESELQARMSTAVDPVALNRVLDVSTVGSSGYVFLIDQEGELIAACLNHDFLAPVTVSSLKDAVIEEGPLRATRSQNPIIRTTTAFLLNHFNGSLASLERAQHLKFKVGHQVFFLYVSLYRATPDTSWLIVTAIPKAALMANVWGEACYIIGLGLIGVGGAIALGLVIAHRLNRAFKRLDEVLQALATGKRDQSLQEIFLVSELQSMAQSFNQMAEQVQFSLDRAQQSLDFSEQRFADIFHSSPDPICIVTLPEGRFLEVNDSFLRTTGYDREAVVGQTTKALKLAVDSAETQAIAQQLHSVGKVRNQEFHWQTSQGEVVTSLLSCDVIELNGQPCVLGISREITERKRVTDAIEQRADELTAMLNTFPDMVFRIRADGTFLDCKAGLHQGLHLSPEHFLNRQLQDVLPASIGEHVSACIDQTLQSGEPVSVEYCLDLPTGTEYFEARMVRFRDDEVIAVSRNISERVKLSIERDRTEQALQESQERSQAILNAIPDLMFLVSRTGMYLSRVHAHNIADVYPTAVDAVGRSLAEVLPAEVGARQLQGVIEALATGETQVFEQRLQLRDNLRHEEVRVAPCGDDRVLIMVRDISDRKRSEAERQRVQGELEAQQSFLRQVLNTLPSSVFVKDPEGRFLVANEVAAKMYGTTADNLIGRKDTDFNSDEAEIATWMATNRQVMETRQIQVDVANQVTTISGVARFYQTTIAPFVSVNGDVQGIIGNSIDITERKRTEDALRESQRALAEAQRIAQLGNWSFDLGSGEITWSEEVFQIFGLDVQQAAPRYDEFIERVHPEDRPDLAAEVERLTQEGGAYEIECRIAHSMGETRVVLAKGQAVQDESGIVVKLFGTAQDITKRKRIETQLRRSLEREQAVARIVERMRQTLDLATIFDSTVQELRQVLLCDRTLIYRFDGPEKGQVVAEAVNHNWPSLMPLTPLAQVMNPLFQRERSCFVRGKSPQAGSPDSVQDPSGNYLSGAKHLRINDIYDANLESGDIERLKQLQARAYITTPLMQGERLWGLLVAYQNDGPRYWIDTEISILIQIGAQLAVAIQQAELFSQVQQQSLELKQAKDAADQASQAKSEFLAMMSHEIRTPMNAVIGMTDLLRETELTPRQWEYLETIRRSGESLLNIINDILDFSKIETDKLVLDISSFNLQACVEETINLLRPQAESKALQLNYTLVPETPTYVKGDVNRLRQILINLIGNALKFTTHGEVGLTVRTLECIQLTATPLYKLQFAICDTGIGIPPETFSRLFQPFSQADASITRRFGGTGLGLVISKRLCEMMGGQIGVTSQVGQGSTFYFTIQAEAGHLATPTQVSRAGWRSAQLPVPDETPQQPQQLHILLVEDVLVNQRVAQHMLQRLGYPHVDVAQNGLEALQRVQQQPYDVIFMDVQMPDMDGLEATRQIRQMSVPQPYIVAVTAHAMVGDRDRCLAAGMDDYLSKPIRRDAVLEVLQRYAVVVGRLT